MRAQTIAIQSTWLTVACLAIISASGAEGATGSREVVTGTVLRVIDADTIDVELTSGKIKVRLHGIDAPELKQFHGMQAAAFLAGKIEDKKVDLEPFQQDQYDRLVAIVYAGDVNVNSELVRLGHAWAYRQYMRKSDGALCAMEAEARLAKRGL